MKHQGRYDIHPTHYRRGYMALVWFGTYICAALFGTDEQQVRADARQYLDLFGRGVE